MMQSRTHTCGELRLTNAGENVTIVGWMENVREVGNNFAFVVLRDFYGTTQVVVETEEMMQIIKGIHKESTISVEGTVRERASKNAKQATGDIEVVPEKIELLPYHAMGEHKYAAIGKAVQTFSVPSEEAMSRLNKIFS